MRKFHRVPAVLLGSMILSSGVSVYSIPLARADMPFPGEYELYQESITPQSDIAGPAAEDLPPELVDEVEAQDPIASSEEGEVDSTSLAESGEMAGTADTVGTVESEAEQQEEAAEFSSNWSLGYAAVFYGPALENPGAYQPRPSGRPDLNRPVQLRNYAHLTYAVTDKLAITGTAYWLWQAPSGGSFSIQDPQLRVSYNRIIESDDWNLYADARFHIPVSTNSRANDLNGGFQLFQAISYTVPNTSLTANLFLSQRFNLYGRKGIGNDVELYFAPNVTFQAFPTLAVALTVESGASHAYGDTYGALASDGLDIEPGLIWDITPSLTFNPYLNFYPTAVTARNTMIGATLNWTIF